MKARMAGFSLVLLTALFLACKENRSSENESNTVVRTSAQESIAKPPEARNLPKQQLQAQVDREIRDALALGADSLVGEAAEVVAETNLAVSYLLDKNYDAANKAIANAIGKAEVITSVQPRMGLVPLEVKAEVHDLVADLETLKRIRNEVEDLTEEGYLQAARQALEGLRSEVNIQTASLPLATYPAALKTAARLSHEKKPLEAAVVLNTALNTIAVEARDIPLPLIRAEGLLAHAATLIDAPTPPFEDIDLLLDHADYEIRFAEALGYGKKDKEFEELYDAIKDLKAEVRKKEVSGEVRGMMSNLRNKLKAFKDRISPKTKAQRASSV